MQSSNGRPRGGGPDGTAAPEHHPAPSAVGAPESARHDDPWYDALASGWGESVDGTATTSAAVPAPRGERSQVAAADVYLEVQRSAAFQEVRSRYRRFVVPAVAGFLLWYVGYVVAATAAPAFMARPVVGAVNVAMVAGLGQFLSTFLLTWAYARHARLRRDRAALELRWDTQEMTRGARGGAV
ncbi:DUF485 domain-containing protein [Streptomyces sp. NPDC028635]|uniref:DUF485 domain-containing protein n=1 Tax=Streptomyces sp. NPDC028635 TaxID=3154800 RepID=UPI0033D3AC25